MDNSESMLVDSDGYFMATPRGCAKTELFGYYDELMEKGAIVRNTNLFDVAVERAVAMCGEQYREEIEEEVQELLPSQKYETPDPILDEEKTPTQEQYESSEEEVFTEERPDQVLVDFFSDDEFDDVFEKEGLLTPPRTMFPPLHQSSPLES